MCILVALSLALSVFFTHKIHRDMRTNSNKLLRAAQYLFLDAHFFFFVLIRIIHTTHMHTISIDRNCSKSVHTVSSRSSFVLFFFCFASSSSVIISINSENQINLECDRLEYSNSTTINGYVRITRSLASKNLVSFSGNFLIKFCVFFFCSLFCRFQFVSIQFTSTEIVGFFSLFSLVLRFLFWLHSRDGRCPLANVELGCKLFRCNRC